MYKDKEKQKQAQREAMKRYRAKGITEQGITLAGPVIPKTIKDCTGQEHQVDYEGRQKRYNLLKAWAEGKGTLRQQVMGRLSLTYNLIKGIDLNSYLGLT